MKGAYMHSNWKADDSKLVERGYNSGFLNIIANKQGEHRDNEEHFADFTFFEMFRVFLALCTLSFGAMIGFIWLVTLFNLVKR